MSAVVFGSLILAQMHFDKDRSGLGWAFLTLAVSGVLIWTLGSL